jgi:hypothetical protein
MVPVATFSIGAVNFGSQVIDTASDAQTVTLTNTGNAVLTISSITLTSDPGTHVTEFGTSNNCPAALAVNASCTFRIRFAPLNARFLAAAILITDNAPVTDPINLSGTGTASPITLSSDRIEFGNQAVGTSSTVQQVTLTNKSTASINLSSIWWNGAPAGTFAVSTTCGSALAASGTCVIRMRFDPKATGLVRSVVYITNGATTSPLLIHMAGTGVATPAP